jgi:hypothetical protein
LRFNPNSPVFSQSQTGDIPNDLTQKRPTPLLARQRSGPNLRRAITAALQRAFPNSQFPNRHNWGYAVDHKDQAACLIEQERQNRQNSQKPKQKTKKQNKTNVLGFNQLSLGFSQFPIGD